MVIKLYTTRGYNRRGYIIHNRINILSIYQSKEMQFYIKNSYSDQFQRMSF